MMSKVWEHYGNTGKYEGDANDPMASGDFMAEDVYACEQQQKTLTSPMFSVGAQAKRGEYAVQRFQEEEKKWMQKHGAFNKKIIWALPQGSGFHYSLSPCVDELKHAVQSLTRAYLPRVVYT